MVQRCSNGVGFIVLEAEPSFRTGISIEIYDAANPSNLIDVLPDSFGRKWTDPRKGTGAGEFKVYASNPKVLANPTLLKAGNIVRMLLDRVPRFAFKIESRQLTQIGEGEDSDIAWHIKGRGALSLLEDGQIYPVGGLAGVSERTFTDQTPGDVLLELIGEAQARSNSILSQITEGFTATEDANNIPYDTLLSLDERAGTDLLRVAERITELAADVYMTPLLELRVVNARGVDRTVQSADVGPVVMQPGQNILELNRSEDAVIRNALLIETPGGFVERLEASSISTYRRREAYISLGSITASDQIDRAAEAVFERSANPAESITIKVTDDDGRRPYVDWGVGDWVLSPDIEGILERFRVNSLTINELDDGTIEAIPELATLTDDLEERLSKWLKAMARGTMGGTAAEVAEPNRVAAEVSDAIDSSIGLHEATYLHPDELSDLADVDITGLATLDLLQYDGADWVPLDLKVDLTTPATDGQVLAYDDASGKWLPADGGTGGGGGGGGSAVAEVAGVIYLDSDQAISSATETEIAFDTQLFNVGGFVDLANNGFTVPSGEPGRYHFNALAHYETSRTDIRLRFRVNGTAVGPMKERDQTAEGTFSALEAEILLDLAAGDTVTVEFYSGGGTNTLRGHTADAESVRCQFEGHRTGGPAAGGSSGATVEDTQTDTGASPHSLDASGVSEGDIVIAVMATRNSDPGAISGGAAWSELYWVDLSSNEEVRAFIKVAGPSEPASYSWTHSAGVDVASVLVVLSGLDGTIIHKGRQSSRLSPVVLGSSNGLHIVISQCCFGATALTLDAPPDTTEVINFDNNDQGIIVSIRDAKFPAAQPQIAFTGGDSAYVSSAALVIE